MPVLLLLSKHSTDLINQQLTPIERYALHYLEYLHVSDDETALKVASSRRQRLFPSLMGQMC